MSRHEIDDQLLALCKAELRLYPARKERFELLVSGADLSDKPRPPIPQGPGVDPYSRKTNAVSKPTERIAVALADSEEFQELKWWVNLTERFLTILSDEQRRWVELSLFKGKDRGFVLDEMGISKGRYYQLMAQCFERYAIISGKTR